MVAPSYKMRFVNSIVLLILFCIFQISMVNASLSASDGAIILTNTTMHVGQTVIVNAIISGGDGGQYTGQFSWIAPNPSDSYTSNPIFVGQNPFPITFNSSGALAYVINECGNPCSVGTVSIIDTANNVVVNTINVGYQSYARGSMVFNPSHTLAYVLNSCGGSPCTTNANSTVSVVNLSTDTVVNTITVEHEASNLTLNPSGSLAYVINQYGTNSIPFETNGTVSVINTTTNTVVNTITVDYGPSSILSNPSGSLIYVLNSIGNHTNGTISVIQTSTATIINTITVGHQPGLNSCCDLSFNPSHSLIYVIDENSDSVIIINTTTDTVVNTITVGRQASYTTSFNPSGSLAYVNNYCGNGPVCNGAYPGTVSAIDTSSNTVINTITAGYGPEFGVSLNPSGTFGYISNNCGADPTCNSNATITVFATENNTVISTIPINEGAYPDSSPNFNPAGTLIYMSNGCNDPACSNNNSTVSVISNLPETAIQKIPIVQSSNSLLQLSIFAQSSNTLIFSFNGINYTVSTGSNTISGKWKLYGFANDGNENTILLSNTLLIQNSTPNPNTTSTTITTTISTPSNGGGSPQGGNGGIQVTTVPATTIPVTTIIQNNTGSTTIPQTNRSTTTITSTITTPQRTPITIIVTPIQNTTTQLCNGTSKSYAVNYQSIGSNFTVNPANPNCFTINATNVTSAVNTPNSNFTKIIIVNLTVSTSNASVNDTVAYPCSIPSSQVAPFILKNGTWSTITPFTVNAASCTVTFAVPTDPIIGLFVVPVNSTTTTVIQIPQQTGASISLGGLWVVLIIILIILAFFYIRKKKN